MQVEESMMRFPSQCLDSPSTVFSDSDTSMSVDPMVNTSAPMHMTGCYPTADMDGVAEFHSADGYDGQLYAMQRPSPAYPISDFDRLDLKDLENIFGPAEVDHQLVTANGSVGSPAARPLEADEHIMHSMHTPQQRSELERSNSLSQSPRHQLSHGLQHSASLRIMPAATPRPTAGTRTSRHVPNGGGARSQVRSSKPVFPTESVPLQQVSRRERPPSATPSILSTRSDPFDTRSTCHSIGAISDPGYAYSVKSMQSRDSGTGSVCSAPGGLTNNSTRDFFDAPGEPDTTKACMEVEMNMKDVKKIIELDKKILKLQAERSKLVEKASLSTSRAASPSEQYEGTISKPQEIVRVHLFFVPVGIHVLDEPVFEEASTLLRRIGGKYLDLERAIATLRNICCKGMAVVPDFSTCFAYIKSLLHETQRLQLTDSGGIYQIKLDPGPSGGAQALPQEFTDALYMANRVLHAAQSITHSYHAIQMQLQKVQGMARTRSESCDSLCQQIGLLERDRRSQIKSVLDGNFATVSTAVRVWPQYYGAATETIRAITQCIHPSNM